MSIEIKTKYGQIDISTDVIATIAGGAADVLRYRRYGIKNQLKDGLTDILRKKISLEVLLFVKMKMKYILICILL